MRRQVWIAIAIAGILMTTMLLSLHYSAPKPQLGLGATWDFSSSTACLNACWQGLKLDETTEEDLLDFYKSPEFTLFNATSYEGGYTSYTALYKNSFFVNSLGKGNRLLRIQLSGYPDLPVSVVIHNWGKPTHTLLAYRPGPHNRLDGYLGLYYPERGTIFTAQIPKISRQNNSETTICLEETDVVSIVGIFPMGSIAKILRREALPFKTMSDAEIEARVSKFIAWPGFGCHKLPSI
jgi:hypothetical protein